MKPSRFFGVLMAALLWAATSVMANPLSISRDTSLYSEARAGSKVVAQLRTGTQGEQIGKQGAWINVKTAGGTGWVLSTNVTFGEGSATTASSGSSSGGFNPFSRRSSSQSTTTIGIRGFDEETISSALGGGAVSAAQLALLEGYKAEKPDGDAFASSKSLQASKVPY